MLSIKSIALLTAIIWISTALAVETFPFSSLGRKNQTLPNGFSFQDNRIEFEVNYMTNSEVLVGKLGNVYAVETNLNNGNLKVRNIVTMNVFEVGPEDVCYEVTEYEGIRPGDDAILLSNNTQIGSVWKLFSDGTTVLISKDNSSYIVGNRPKKRRLATSLDYSEGSSMIDNHHYSGSTLGYFSDDFLLYSYNTVQKVGVNDYEMLNLSRTVKVIHPPFRRHELKSWLTGLAKEYARGDYFHRGESSAQLAMSVQVFQDFFLPELKDYIRNISSFEFYSMIKHLLWSDSSPRSSAERIRRKILRDLETF